MTMMICHTAAVVAKKISQKIEEDTIVWNIPEDYALSGVESDDDSVKCWHWSKQCDPAPGVIKAVSVMLEHGKPSQRFPDNCKSHNLIEAVLDNAYLDMCITAKNEHDMEHAEFQKKIGRI